MSYCKLGEILTDETTTADEAAILKAAIADRNAWPAGQLAKAVNKTRFSVGATTIKEHRRRSCGCFQ